MITVDGLHSEDLGTSAHIVGHIFLQKLLYLGAKKTGDNVKILDRRMRAWNQLHNPNVPHVKGDLTINRLRESSGYPELKATAVAVRECAPFALEPAKTSS